MSESPAQPVPQTDHNSRQLKQPLRLGTSGWYYDDWPGKIYPAGLKKGEWLAYYSTRFNTVEVNNTFYRLPRTSMLEGWRTKTTPHFRFSVKGNRVITHTKKLVDVGEELAAFYALASVLEEKLGPVLWQLPPSLRRDDGRLEAFCAALSRSVVNVIEFRHASWFTEPVYKILRRHGVTCCLVSIPGLPDVAVQTAPAVYLRFHGLGTELYKYDYREDELRPWITKLRELRAAAYWVYFNNTFYGNGALNAERFGKLWEE